jgi:hypothetical protein
VRRLTNKQVTVLELLRDVGPLTVNEIAEKVTAQTICSVCDGTGEGDSRFGCGACYGRGHPYFHYSQAYQALKSLRSAGLVRRRCARDEWGDEIPRHVYYAVPSPAADPLEALWNAPTAEERP